MITTNLKKDEITALISHSLTYLSYEVEQYYVPTEGLWYYNDNTDVGSVIEIANMDAQRLAFAQFIYEDALLSPTGETYPAPTTLPANTPATTPETTGTPTAPQF